MANVRSIAVIVASLGLASATAHAQAPGDRSQGTSTVGSPDSPRVIVAVLPRSTGVEEIGRVDGISPGVVSAGIGVVASSQTYLDITQGNRLAASFYDSELPLSDASGGRVPPALWRKVVSRAESAPADIVPGLLADTLAGAGIPAVAELQVGGPALTATDRGGKVERARACGPRGCGPGLSVVKAGLGRLRRIVGAVRGDDLVIAIGEAPPPDLHLLAAGVAGEGFDGTLTSDSTRTRGVVLSTDLAPTVLRRLGVVVPDEMNGSEIAAEGTPDAVEVADLQQRLSDRPRREVVLLTPLAAWTALTALAALAFGSRGARVALPLLALSCAWAPFMLLVGAALDPGQAIEVLITGLGSVALAVGTRALLPGLRGLAVACGVTVAAHAVDVVLGSPLTSLSVLGPNPAGGVRFFGIGNELEAVLTVLTLVGTGAWIASAPPRSRRAAAASFLLVALLAAAAFAPGRFGADVGAAIVLAAGGAAAASLALGLDRRRTALVVVGLPALALAAVALVDLVFGGAHLTRTVLGAGGADDVWDAFDRRLTLTLRSFTDPVYPELLVLAVLLLAAGLVLRDRIMSWFASSWAARCGYLGAFAGILVGTAANDSGAILLVIGMILLAVFAGFFWAVGAPRAEAVRSP